MWLIIEAEIRLPQGGAYINMYKAGSESCLSNFGLPKIKSAIGIL